MKAYPPLVYCTWDFGAFLRSNRAADERTVPNDPGEESIGADKLLVLEGMLLRFVCRAGRPRRSTFSGMSLPRY